jgi:hypothetical protein
MAGGKHGNRPLPDGAPTSQADYSMPSMGFLAKYHRGVDLTRLWQVGRPKIPILRQRYEEPSPRRTVEDRYATVPVAPNALAAILRKSAAA